MKTNLIVGAGQLGSRHLQGLLKITAAQEIYLVDPSEASLEIARTRAAATATIHYATDWAALPKKFDLVIVATNANVRAAIAKRLLQEYQIEYLILEKVLFQDVAAYQTIGDLIATSSAKVWVNHPRRMFQHYQSIKNVLAENPKAPITLTTMGGNWGLACNALHLIDLCAFLSNDTVEQVDLDWVDPIIHNSKRANNIEFTGTIKGRTRGGSNFLITSWDDTPGDITVQVAANNHRWIIQEGANAKVIHLHHTEAAPGFTETVHPFATEYQSGLTSRLATDLFDTGNCYLPTYAEAASAHIPFIAAALKKYNELNGSESEVCPIT